MLTNMTQHAHILIDFKNAHIDKYN